ncbi:unnamed protein product [Camellia sinensis]
MGALWVLHQFLKIRMRLRCCKYGPVDESKKHLPDILCVIQIRIENWGRTPKREKTVEETSIVLTSNATFPNKIPSSSSSLFDQQSTDASSSGWRWLLIHLVVIPLFGQCHINNNLMHFHPKRFTFQRRRRRRRRTNKIFFVYGRNVAVIEVLKLLPDDVMELHLPSIVHRISNFLKNCLESIRDEARTALTACLKELGLEYLQFIVKVLRATLKRGYELHVLGYTLNFILSKCLVNPISGKLDYCLEELSVVENDIFGDVSEEKEVEKVASKMKETRKRKSFETLKLIAQNSTFKTHALKLLSPVTTCLQKHLTPKMKSKLETMLNNIAAGIECNPSVNQTDLFIFLYGLIEDGITHETRAKANQQSGDEASCKTITSGRLIDSGSQSSHLITVFALGVLHNSMKNTKLNKKDKQLLSMLDPFVRLLTDCLTAKYEDIISAALRCLAPLVRLPLPSLESQADKIKTSLLVIAQGSVNAGSPVMQSCLSLLTVLLRSTRITLSTDQLHMVIQFPLFIDLERNPLFVALSLLKAIVNRKLVVHEIYDLVTRVAELLVTSQVEPIRKKCSQILLQFLLDYHLSEKRLQQHLYFLLSNLRYEHSTGREAVLEMLHAIVIKFPKAIIDEHSQTIFVHLVVCLANDYDNKVRSMTGAAVKLLIGHVLGLLVEVMRKGFQKHVNGVLPVMRSIFQSAINVLTNGQLDLSVEATVPFWKEAYYSLVLLEKILHQFHDLFLAKDLEDIWEMISELLLHPHMWLCDVLNRLVALYFASVTEANRENHEKSLETQLKLPYQIVAIGWLRMKLSTNQIKKFPKMLAVDSEMVLREDGTEALVRVFVVGRDLQL